MNPVNLLKIIKKLSENRYKGAVVYGDADIGKTQYINKFIKKNTNIKIKYIDVQKVVADKPNSEFIFDFLNISNFIDWCITLYNSDMDNQYDAIIFDNFDVIVNLWDSETIKEYLNTVSKLERSVYPIPLLFFVQTDPTMVEEYYKHINDEIIRIIDFNKLESI